MAPCDVESRGEEEARCRKNRSRRGSEEKAGELERFTGTERWIERNLGEEEVSSSPKRGLQRYERSTCARGCSAVRMDVMTCRNRETRSRSLADRNLLDGAARSRRKSSAAVVHAHEAIGSTELEQIVEDAKAKASIA